MEVHLDGVRGVLHLRAVGRRDAAAADEVLAPLEQGAVEVLIVAAGGEHVRPDLVVDGGDLRDPEGCDGPPVE
jgi:hypothetical protein